jgi:inosose dehydratase
VTEPAPGNRRLRLGSCPDSWGVWYDDDPRQTPWYRFLDELAEVRRSRAAS